MPMKTNAPPPAADRQGGLLDIVLHPDFDANGWIYFTFSSPGDPDSVVTNDRRGTGTALARAPASMPRIISSSTSLSFMRRSPAVLPVGTMARGLFFSR